MAAPLSLLTYLQINWNGKEFLFISNPKDDGCSPLSFNLPPD
jgi:hypothetical protein